MPTHHDYDADGTVRDEMLAAQEDERMREALGRIVREVWIKWAQEQPNPKPSWLVPYDQLSEPDKDVDNRIGERLFREGIRSLVATYRSDAKDLEALKKAAKVFADESVGDFIYHIRESECKGWDGPRVIAWGEAATTIDRLRKEGKI